MSLLNQVLTRLRDEYTASGKDDLFKELEVYITPGAGAASYAAAGERRDMSEGAVKVAVHRLRRRYRQLLRAEIAQTLSDPRDVDEEIDRLFDAFSD